MADFDLKDEFSPQNCFKSNFARMMAVESKSLDFASFRKNSAYSVDKSVNNFRKSSVDEAPFSVKNNSNLFGETVESNSQLLKHSNEETPQYFRYSKTDQNNQSFSQPSSESPQTNVSTHGPLSVWNQGGSEVPTQDSLKPWNQGGSEVSTQDSLKPWNQGGSEVSTHGPVNAWNQGGSDISNHGSLNAWNQGGSDVSTKAWNQGGSDVSTKAWNQGGSDSDVITLRKECQCLLEENRRLRNADCAGLQQQVDTLHWQLRQNEASRNMHRQVLEQVAKFLDHAHRTLDTLDQGLKEQNSRVVRSHSVYSVAGSGHKMADRLMGHNMADTHGHQDFAAFQDFTWRRTKKQKPTGANTPEKLSKEAFRLLRTVQSLLGTCDPNLSGSRGKDEVQNISEEDDHFQQGRPLSPIMSSTLVSVKDMAPRPSASSASSNEDESGFSSMGSFQEVGLPPLPPPTHHHRRWSSSLPTTAAFDSHDRLHVLWV